MGHIGLARPQNQPLHSPLFLLASWRGCNLGRAVGLTLSSHFASEWREISTPYGIRKGIPLYGDPKTGVLSCLDVRTVLP